LFFKERRNVERSTPFSGFLFLVVVNRNRFQVLRLKDLIAIKASKVIDTVPAVEEFGSLVLTALHSEIKPILDCEEPLSSTGSKLNDFQTDSSDPFVQFYVGVRTALAVSAGLGSPS
jgi:hypothetical protein